MYWHPPDTIPHGPLQRWFYQRTGDNETLAEARRDRQRAIDEPLAPVAGQARIRSAADGPKDAKRAATQCGADDVGVTPMRADYVFAGHDVPSYRWMIVIAVEQDYDAMKSAPSLRALSKSLASTQEERAPPKASPIGFAGKATTLFPTADRWRARSY